MSGVDYSKIKGGWRELEAQRRERHTQLVQVKVDSGPAWSFIGIVARQRLLEIASMWFAGDNTAVARTAALEELQVRGDWASEEPGQQAYRWTGYDYEQQAWIEIVREA